MARDLFAEVLQEKMLRPKKTDVFPEAVTDPFSEDYDPYLLSVPKRVAPQPQEQDRFLAPQKREKQKRGMSAAFQRGSKAGVYSLLRGYKPEEAPTDENWLEHLAAMAGELIYDMPAMWAGAELGAIGGGALGSAVPGLGTAIGATGGAAAGAFALPTMIKQSFAEYRDFVDQGNDLSFGDFLERSARIAKETGKSGVVGLVTGKMHKLLPFLKKVPGMDKILKTNLGRGAVGTGLELTGMTGAEAAMEQELPSLQQIADNALMLTSVKGAHGISAKMRKHVGIKAAVGKIKAEAIGETARVEKGWVEAIAALVPKEVREKVVKKIPEPIKEAGKYVQRLRKTAKQQAYFEALEDHVGKRNAKIVESQFKWRESLEKVQEKKKFTPKQMEEMIYYRQKTGNPFIEGDSYKKLSERLPKEAKHFVDKVVDQHLKKSLKAWNENPVTKDISPREGLESIYLPGLYEYDPKKFARVYEEVSKRFKTKNPFSNEKTFLNYLEAFKDAGLKPRYKNMIDLMQAYDQIMIKSTANAELAEQIRQKEKKTGEKLVVRSTDKEIYKQAKSLGYVPFEDPFLRSYVTGTKDGKPIWATTAAPALVEPQFASAFQGVFTKEAYRQPGKILKALDSARDYIRFTKVALSPFHYGALIESAVGALGVKKGLFGIKGWLKEGAELKQNKQVMKEAAEAGLMVHQKPEVASYKKGEALITKGLKGLQKVTKMPERVVNTFEKGYKYLFDEFHPRLKLVTWDQYNNEIFKGLIEEGISLTEKQTKKVKSDVAKLVNNLYGGQNWETMRWFNDPKNMRIFRRLIGYPDWTTSAIKQAFSVAAPGLKGALARKYWLKYGLFFGATQGLMKWIGSGWKQTDKDGSISGLRFDPSKAWDGLTKGDPTKWYMFPLPDINVKIAGKMFNPGRDIKQRRLYGHFGKQMLEIFNWGKHPFNTFFSKSNPLIQIGFKQITGLSPYQEDWFTVRGKYRGNKMLPWDASKPYTIERAVSRGKELITSAVVPFGIQSLINYGVPTFIATAGGLYPVSKGLSLYSSKPIIEKALKVRDMKSLRTIKLHLKDNGYSSKMIRKTITEIKNKLKRERKKR